MPENRVPPADKPGIVFTMRYPDDTGYVWNFTAAVRDRASADLRDRANVYMAFPKLSGNPSYQPKNLQPVELNCYDTTPAGRAAIEQFVRTHNVKVMVFMSALSNTVCLDLLRRLGVRTINTENDSFDPRQRDGAAKKIAKFLLRRVLRLQQHDLHLANSVAQEQFLLNYQKLPRDKVILMRNSVDSVKFHPGDRTEARARLGLDQDRFWILTVAQARPEKRIDRLLQVVRDVIDARPGKRIGFIYVGDGPPAVQWKQLASALGLADVCVFAGRQNDLVPWYRAAARARLGLDQDRFWILAVSQARPEKRVDRLLHVVRDVIDARPDQRIGFIYVGDGPPAVEWKQRAHELGLDDVCVFAGRQNDLVPYYRAADLLVHAAERESFGNAIVEAMACGIPVVASAALGPKETILDGKTGAVIGLDDFAGFTQAVLRYVDDPEMTKMHGNYARAHVDTAYNVVRQSKEFAAHIARFL
jgi:glycosyltransferase involved in cell wall biosynthesis